jgi:hypothetical protein
MLHFVITVATLEVIDIRGQKVVKDVPSIKGPYDKDTQDMYLKLREKDEVWNAPLDVAEPTSSSKVRLVVALEEQTQAHTKQLTMIIAPTGPSNDPNVFQKRIARGFMAKGCVTFWVDLQGLSNASIGEILEKDSGFQVR